MAADLGFIVHAAEREPLKLAAERASDGAAERGLADARRPDKAQDRPLHVRLEAADGEIVEDAILDLAQLIVVFVENLLGEHQVDLAAGACVPGQQGQPLDVIAGDGVVGRHGRHAAEAGKLLQRFLLGLLRHTRRFQLGAQLLDIALAVVAFAELLLDRLHLLAQVVIALGLLDLVLNLGLDLVAERLNLDFLREVLVDALQALQDVGGLEQFLPVRGSEEGQRGGDKVRKARAILDLGGNGLKLVRKGRRGGNDAPKIRDDVLLQGHKLKPRGRGNFRDGLDRGGHEWLELLEVIELDALAALGEHEEALVGHFDNFMDRRQGAVPEEIGRLRGVLPRVALSDHDDGALLAEGLNEMDGAVAADCQRQNGMRKQDRVAQGKHGVAAPGGRRTAFLFLGGAGTAGTNNAQKITGHESTFINLLLLDAADFVKMQREIPADAPPVRSFRRTNG